MQQRVLLLLLRQGLRTTTSTNSSTDTTSTTSTTGTFPYIPSTKKGKRRKHFKRVQRKTLSQKLPQKLLLGLLLGLRQVEATVVAVLVVVKVLQVLTTTAMAATTMAATTMATTSTATRLNLKDTLFGPPITKRHEQTQAEIGTVLSSLLNAVLHFLEEDMDMNSPNNSGVEWFLQMKAEWNRVSQLPNDQDGISCKRAAFLFAISNVHMEEFCQQMFREKEDSEFVNDLRSRILPIFTPSFLRGMAQGVEQYVISVCIMHEMFKGEEPCKE